MQKTILFLFLLLIIGNVDAAVIRGTIYDIGLKEINNAILVVNSKPEQTLVLKDSSYSLNLPKGNYKIKAYYYENSILESYTENDINVISNDGEYNLDLILFPSFQEEDILFNESNFDVQENVGFERKAPTLFIVFIALILVVYFIYKFRKKVTKKHLEKELENKFDDIYLNNVLNIIKRNDGRITQKEIRKELKISEAKVSLILSQLESEGKIKKIKKGRGNIVILNSR